VRRRRRALGPSRHRERRPSERRGAGAEGRHRLRRRALRPLAPARRARLLNGLSGAGPTGVAEHPQPPLLEVEGLTLEFPVGGARVRVVSGVSFAVGAGEILGLVGTSGSGKTMTALALFRLVPPPGRIAAGRIRIAGADLLELGREPLRRLR